MQTKSFLSHVAADLLERFGNNLAHVAVVFPNKRAALFLNKELARQAGRPIWSPSYVTISELFRSQCDWQVADPIKAVCDLHKTYMAVTGTSDSLDHFYSWGQLLLADFDDIDKNMAEARQVFRNLTDLHEMDDLSYLTDRQKELIARFFSSFNADDTNSVLRERFLRVWSKLAYVYEAYRKQLQQQGLAYEGMLYRHVAEMPALKLPAENYVFIGFNVLQQVEQQLFTRLQREGKATFYWNFDEYYLLRSEELGVRSEELGARNEAGVYIGQWLSRFPNALSRSRSDIFDNLSRPKDVAFVSAPTEDLQARYVTTWLRENERWRDGERTAIVMADESLLGTIVHCIPPEVKEVNITTGYPLSQTPIASLVSQLVNVQLHGYNAARTAFRLHAINGVLRHPYAKMLSPEAEDLRKTLNQQHRFYPNPSEIPFLVVPPSDHALAALTQWLKDSVETVAKSPSHPTDDPLFEESVFRMFTLLQRLHDLVVAGDLLVDEVTFQKLLSQLIRDTTIPFHGKPAVGVQVMGVLETRNLDFDHVLVLSCNEGNLPRGVDDTSFIPHALRKAYGLTTIDNKVAIYSYYFHSLLQRASDVTLVYNSSPDGAGGGSMSRFMLQLLTELPMPIRQMSLLAEQQVLSTRKTNQEKTSDVVAKLSQIQEISPTALNTYLKCRKSYFYKYIADIKEDDNTDEDIIDGRLFGNIFHRAAQLIYETLLPRDLITAEDIKSLLARKNALDEVLNQAFNEELFKQKQNAKRMPTLDGLQLINREVIEKYLRRLLRIDLQLTPFQVIAHEEDVKSLPLHVGGRDVCIKGRIDRLDRINIGQPDECLRVVDYKTGSTPAGDPGGVPSIFTAERIEDRHSDYTMQAIAYSLVMATNAPQLNPRKLPVRPALFFIQKAGEDYDPSLSIGTQPITDVLTLRDEFRHELAARLSELFSPEEPFAANGRDKTCSHCPYAQICGEI